MKQQTAVEWLDTHSLGLISFDSEKLRELYKYYVQQAKEIENEKRIGDMTKLLRWVLKRYETGTTVDGFFMWQNQLGEQFDSIDLVTQYHSETFKNK